MKILRRALCLILIAMVCIGWSISALAYSRSEIQARMISILYGGQGGSMTCDFDGYQNTSGRHEGIDFSLRNGASVYAICGGTITRVTYGSEGSGGLSTIAVYYAPANKTVVYLHSAPVSGLAAGQEISAGQKIATQSWRGVSSASSGHTHVEVVNGWATSAKKSVNDYTLENSDPYPFWESVVFPGKPVTYPGKPSLSVSASNSLHETVLSWNATSNTTGYDIRIYSADGQTTLCDKRNFQRGTQFYALLPAGTYQADIASLYDPDGTWTSSDRITFTVSHAAASGMGNYIDSVAWNGKLYSLYQKHQCSWLEAKNLAEQYGGHLMTITCQEEQNIAAQFAQKANSWVWIGAEMFSKDWGTWITGESIDYTNWAPYEPNNGAGGENCVNIFADGTWNDIPSSGSENIYGYIIESNYPTVDMGESFDGYLIATEEWMHLIYNADGNNVELESQFGDHEKAIGNWRFDRQSDGSYIITSLYNGMVLDLYWSGTTNGTNVKVWVKSEEENMAQRWYLVEWGTIAPKIAPKMRLDVTEGSFTYGTNIQIWEANGLAHQKIWPYKREYDTTDQFPTGLVVEPAISLIADTSKQIPYYFTPSNALDNRKGVIWTSSDTSIATVSDGGIVKGVRAGTAVITATSVYNDRFVGQCTVTVLDVLRLPASLNVIDAEAFAGSGAAAIIIPDKCEQIRMRAFAACPNLVEIHIPESVFDISTSAFDGCSDSLVIYGAAGSAAEKFAKGMGYKFIIE